MNKKHIIFIISPIIITAIFLLIFIKVEKPLSGNLTLVLDESQNKNSIYNKYLLNIYTNNNDVTSRLVVSENESYIDYIESGLTLPNRSEDIYYSVFSSQLYNRVLKTNNIKMYSNYISREIPQSFYTFAQSGDNYFYIPITWSPWGFYYNKEIFNSLNLVEPKTLKELDMINETLLKNNITPYSMVQNLKWPLTTWFDYLNIRKNGTEFHNQLLSGLISFTDSKVLGVFNALYDMIAAGNFYISDDYNWVSMLETFSEGKTAMVLGGTFFFENAPDLLKENMGWFPFPLENIKDEYDEIVSSSGYIINGKTDNPKVIDEYIKYVLSKEGQRVIEEYSDFYPINEEVIDTLNREDLNEGLDNISKAENLIPSFERNTNSTIQFQFKLTLNRLFDIENKEDIITLLENLEDYKENKSN